MNRKYRLHPALFLVATGIAGLVGCTTDSEFPNPPSACSQATLAGCTTMGFSCTGLATPEATNAALLCGAGMATGDATLYCCNTPAPCAATGNVSDCPKGARSYSCSGSDTPDQANASLTCSTGTPGNGVTLYCCTN